MNKILKLVYSNKFFAITTLLLQVGMIVGFVIGFSSNVRYYLLVSNFITAVLILVEVNRHEESAFKVTWIMLMAVMPIFGWFFYIYTHTGVISRNIKKSHNAARDTILRFKIDDSDTIKSMNEERRSTSLAKFLSKACGSSVYQNTLVKYYPLGDDMMSDIVEELEKAEKFIFMEFFIINQSSYMWQTIEEILIRKARAGVDVRLMYDGMGCMGIMPKGYDEELERRGIKCQVFSPLQPLLSTYQNNRDHRKIIIVDGVCAISGGINLADEYINRITRFGHWKDTGLRIYGDGVMGFTEMFLTMWYTVTGVTEDDFDRFLNVSKLCSYPDAVGYITPFGDSPLDNIYAGRTAYMDILNNAKKYVYIMTPYFVIDDAIYEAMNYAVTRGVNVKLILPGIPDKKAPYCLARSYYKDLLDIGVEIYEYIPGFVHAKTTVSDDCRAIVGTINYDYRSLYLHYECAAYLVNVPQIRDIETDMMDTLSYCRHITRTEYAKIPWYYRATGRILRFIATMI